MKQPDRRRSLLPGGNGSGWDFEFQSSNGVLPPEEKMNTSIVAPSISSESTAEFVNGYYRLTGKCTDQYGGGGMAISLNPSYLGQKCEAECAFYVRNFSVSEMALQFGIRTLNGINFLVRVTNTRICVLYQVDSYRGFVNCSKTIQLNTRYVIRSELDGVNRVAKVYVDDELLSTKTNYFIEDSSNYACQVMAMSMGYYSPATVDIEYLKYRRL